MVSLKEFNAIIQYAQKKMKKELDSNINANAESVIWWMNDWSEITYEDWYKQYKPKRERAQITGKYEIPWKKFWTQWPAMRTFEYKRQKFICNKPFRGAEEKMYQKYVAILEDKKENITPEQLHECARKALLNCMQESYRRGTNQMEYMSGMEPWLNQKQWRNWMHIEIKENIPDKHLSTDIDI